MFIYMCFGILCISKAVHNQINFNSNASIYDLNILYLYVKALILSFFYYNVWVGHNRGSTHDIEMNEVHLTDMAVIFK